MADRAVEAMRVRPGKKANLAERAADDTFGWERDEAEAELAGVRERLAALQHVLYAESARALLVVLQSMDASGKDGTIRHVMTGFNPAGTAVHGFKAPSTTELAHDYLWRVHAACPERGRIGVFNRSHYEDVLVVRVKELVPESRWRVRYEHIRAFEEMLADEGTTVLKIHLHISFEEQRERLQDRVDDPNERWKFRAGDLDDRKLWPQYMEAYEEALSTTSTKRAPWYVVPADRKWVRNLAVARILLHTLEGMDPQFPEPDPDAMGIIVS